MTSRGRKWVDQVLIDLFLLCQQSSHATHLFGLIIFQGKWNFMFEESWWFSLLMRSSRFYGRIKEPFISYSDDDDGKRFKLVNTWLITLINAIYRCIFKMVIKMLCLFELQSFVGKKSQVEAFCVLEKKVSINHDRYLRCRGAINCLQINSAISFVPEWNWKHQQFADHRVAECDAFKNGIKICSKLAVSAFSS